MTTSATKKIEYWFVFQNDRLLVPKTDQASKLLAVDMLGQFKTALVRQHLLMQFDTYSVYCAELDGNYALTDDVELISLRKALELLGTDWYNIASRAFTIITWDKTHQYCGRCGHATEQKPQLFERFCPACSLVFYPRISPSIIVMIRKGDTILMARSPHFPPGVYGLIAGFVEAGESVEDAVHREVKEEVGIEVKNLQFFGSQPWPFPDSLMIAFTAEYASGELLLNHNEIEDAGWYQSDNIPGRPSSSVSIARKLIEYFIAEQQRKNLK